MITWFNTFFCSNFSIGILSFHFSYIFRYYSELCITIALLSYFLKMSVFLFFSKRFFSFRALQTSFLKITILIFLSFLLFYFKLLILYSNLPWKQEFHIKPKQKNSFWSRFSQWDTYFTGLTPVDLAQTLRKNNYRKFSPTFYSM